jgi:hypothetical protein
MDVLARLLLRFILVPLGAAVALLAAAAIILIAHRNALIAVLDADPQAQQDYFIALSFGGPLLAVLLSISAFYMLVPAAIGVLISEALAIRSWLFHAANGGLSAWLGWAMTQSPRYPPPLAGEGSVGGWFLAEPRILVAAGLLAGLAYWIVSGWTAGFWKPIRSPPRPTPPS